MRHDVRGAPVLVAVGLVVANYVAQFFPTLGMLADTNLLLHLGIAVGLLGLLVGDALG